MHVTIADTTAPTFDYTQFNDMLWPPNHKWVKIAEVSNVADLVDGDPTVAIDVISNEVVNGKGDGNTAQDGKVVQNGDVWEVWVRSERAGPKTGREYHIQVNVSDDAGNTATAEGTVTVPHDMRNKNGKGL